ncbi:MAG: hypothetical protein ACP5G1_02050 [Nanopusillaceae archaeon]
MSLEERIKNYIKESYYSVKDRLEDIFREFDINEKYIENFIAIYKFGNEFKEYNITKNEYKTINLDLLLKNIYKDLDDKITVEKRNSNLYIIIGDGYLDKAINNQTRPLEIVMLHEILHIILREKIPITHPSAWVDNYEFYIYKNLNIKRILMYIGELFTEIFTYLIYRMKGDKKSIDKLNKYVQSRIKDLKERIDLYLLKYKEFEESNDKQDRKRISEELYKIGKKLGYDIPYVLGLFLAEELYKRYGNESIKILKERLIEAQKYYEINKRTPEITEIIDKDIFNEARNNLYKILGKEAVDILSRE